MKNRSILAMILSFFVYLSLSTANGGPGVGGGNPGTDVIIANPDLNYIAQIFMPLEYENVGSFDAYKNDAIGYELYVEKINYSPYHCEQTFYEKRVCEVSSSSDFNESFIVDGNQKMYRVRHVNKYQTPTNFNSQIERFNSSFSAGE